MIHIIWCIIFYPKSAYFKRSEPKIVRIDENEEKEMKWTSLLLRTIFDDKTKNYIECFWPRIIISLFRFFKMCTFSDIQGQNLSADFWPGIQIGFWIIISQLICSAIYWFLSFSGIPWFMLANQVLNSGLICPWICGPMNEKNVSEF